jgi:bacterioferritin
MKNVSIAESHVTEPFLTDVKALREQARRHIEKGAVSRTYVGDVTLTVDILQCVLATELVCVLRYTQHSIAATGLASEGVKAEFAQHAKEEMEHVMAVAERINQLGAAPNFDPKDLASRSASEYATGSNMVAMIRENLIAERIAVDHYRELIRFFGDNDPTTRVMIESILAVEEEHASDMLDLLATHEGVRPNS